EHTLHVAGVGVLGHTVDESGVDAEDDGVVVVVNPATLHGSRYARFTGALSGKYSHRDRFGSGPASLTPSPQAITAIAGGTDGRTGRPTRAAPGPGRRLGRSRAQPVACAGDRGRGGVHATA